MYFPRLRRISDVILEIKAADRKTVISRWFITQLIRSEEITALKYGDAWLINLDELYGYLSGCIPQNFDYIPPNGRLLMTSGGIYRLFLKCDGCTIIRKPNLRRFVQANGIFHFISSSGKWLIDYNEFIQKINPRRIDARVEMPRLRWHDDSIRNFKQKHPDVEGASMTVAEQAFKSDRVFKTLNGQRWIINYDQLEQEILRILKEEQPPT